VVPHAPYPALQLMPQLPWLHVAVPPLPGTGHAVQLAPQWVGSPSVSKHVPPQFVRGAGHAQVPPWHVVPPVQAVPHVPQLASSVITLEHDPEHRVVPDGQPEAHAYVVPERAQTGVAPLHAVVHEPQCAAALRSVSQTSAGLLEQCWYPAAHVYVQMPFVHARPAATTCDRSVQSVVQLPQVWRSLAETQPAAHASWSARHPIDESPAATATSPALESITAGASGEAAASAAASATSSPAVASGPVPASFVAEAPGEKSPRREVHPVTGVASANANAPTSPRQNLVMSPPAWLTLEPDLQAYLTSRRVRPR
jgi:hypothetical protein